MFWHLDASFIALAIILVISADLIIHKAFSSPHRQDKIFAATALSFLTINLIDILSSAVMMMPNVNWWVYQLSLTLYFITALIPCLMWLIYTHSFSKTDFFRKSDLYLYFVIAMPYLVYVLATMTNPWSSFVFHLSPKLEYTRNIGYVWGSLLYFFYMFLTTVSVLWNRRRLKRAKAALLMLFPVFTAVAFYCQVYVFPSYLLVCPAYACILLTSHLLLQNTKRKTDHLTGLPNRNALINALNGGENLSRSLIMLSVNDFSFVNERYGNVLGDNLLKEVAEELKTFSADESVYRSGGDEFILMFKDSSPAHTEELLAMIKKRFESPWNISDAKLTLVLSIGVVSLPMPEDSRIDPLSALELAVREGKQKNSTSVTYYDAALSGRYNRQRQVLAAVRDGIAQKRFKTYFQPIYNVDSGRFDRAEALCRLRDPKLSWISPDEFIPIAEESEYINDITDIVLDNSCRMARELYDQGAKTVIHVNLSAENFLQPDFTKRILTTIDKYSIPPSLITLEITEHLLLLRDKSAEAVLRELSEKGVTFAIDDYGTGYSNLTYLANIPAAIVKLDKSILKISNDGGNFILSLMEMMDKIKKTVIAEGVETEDQETLAVKAGCKHIQGYFHAVPMEESAFESFMINHNLNLWCENINQREQKGNIEASLAD